MGQVFFGVNEEGDFYRPFITLEQDSDHVEFFCSIRFKELDAAQKFIESVFLVLNSTNKKEVRHCKDGNLPMPLFVKNEMI